MVPIGILHQYDFDIYLKKKNNPVGVSKCINADVVNSLMHGSWVRPALQVA